MSKISDQILILRFRDLVTDNDETIQKHKKIIEKYGYVWWAWWKKGHEQVPFKLLGEWLIHAKANPVIVYLVDSGQKKLYKAICSDINVNEKIKNSPEPQKTPDYYNAQAYQVWFKFTSIDQCEANEINKYSYIKIDDLFKTGTSNYDLFWNKRIYDLDELIQQQRTIWLARKFQEGDKENEITLLNASVVQPNAFSERYYEVQGNTLLWLSDLHLGDSEFDIMEGPGKTSLTRHILGCCKDDKNDITGILLSGDITSCAKREGFDAAKKFINSLNRELVYKLDSENIIICPGNHDFKRIDESLDTEQKLEYVKPNTDCSQHYSDFYKDIYHISPNDYFAIGRKLLLQSGTTLEIAAINSNRLKQYKDFEGHGYISQEQLDYVEKEMKWGNKNNSAIRIVVMHHNYLPVCYEEEIKVGKANSAIYDANMLMEWLAKNKVKLLLHGHKHRTFAAKICYPPNSDVDFINDMDFHDIYVVGMGGTGAKNVKNTFSTLNINGNELLINFYEIHSDNIESDSWIHTIKIPLK